MKQYDILQRFVFEDAPVRGEIIQLKESYQEVLRRHPYPLSVQLLLGQALTVVSLLSVMLKHQGAIILQIQGDGALSLLLAQANAQQQIRGLANWEGAIPETFKEAVGKGHLALTIDPGQGSERYQGIVALKGNSLASVVIDYFDQSEQIPTLLYLAADANTTTGLLLQLIPDVNHYTSPQTKEYWQHISHLANTITQDELLSLSAETILHRLFHQEKINYFTPQNVEFVCRCSRDAMAKAIMTLGYEDAKKLASEKQIIAVTCEFCNNQINFDRIDIERIFSLQNSYMNKDSKLH